MRYIKDLRIVDAPGDDMDVLVLVRGNIVAIDRDGIEVWPSLDSCLAADPEGDFAEMLGFIEHDSESGDGPQERRRLDVVRSRRFGGVIVKPHDWGFRIHEVRSYHATEFGYTVDVVELTDGYVLCVSQAAVSLWRSMSDLEAAVKGSPLVGSWESVLQKAVAFVETGGAL